MTDLLTVLQFQQGSAGWFFYLDFMGSRDLAAQLSPGWEVFKCLDTWCWPGLSLHGVSLFSGLARAFLPA